MTPSYEVGGSGEYDGGGHNEQFDNIQYGWYGDHQYIQQWAENPALEAGSSTGLVAVDPETDDNNFQSEAS